MSSVDVWSSAIQIVFLCLLYVSHKWFLCSPYIFIQVYSMWSWSVDARKMEMLSHWPPPTPAWLQQALGSSYCSCTLSLCKLLLPASVGSFLCQMPLNFSQILNVRLHFRCGTLHCLKGLSGGSLNLQATRPNELLLVLQTEFHDLKPTTTLTFPTTAEKLYCSSGRWKTTQGLLWTVEEMATLQELVHQTNINATLDSNSSKIPPCIKSSLPPASSSAAV